MSAKHYITIVLHVAIAMLSFACSVITAWQAIWVLSSHDHNHFKRLEVMKFNPENQSQGSMIIYLTWDALLVCLFVFQHSFLSIDLIHKRIINTFDITPVQRNVYVTCTCACLQLMMMFWKKVDFNTFWAIDTSNRELLWWIFTIVHTLGWITIYGETLIMDLGELLGLKHVYYELRGLPEPMSIKAPKLKTLQYHMRHGGALSLSLIMWIHPVMTLDRVMLTMLLSFYMANRFHVAIADYDYLKRMNESKEEELKLL